MVNSLLATSLDSPFLMAIAFTVTVSVEDSTGNLPAVSDPADLGSLLSFTNDYYEDGSVVFSAEKKAGKWPMRRSSSLRPYWAGA